MKFAGTLTAAAVFLALGGVALAQNYGPPPPPPGSDPYGYYSQYDHQGYYDREGHYVRFKHDDYSRSGDNDSYGDNDRDYDAPQPPPPPAYYQQEHYERACRSGNQAAGTIFGAIAGGLLGSAVSHGRGGAVVGGAVLGGILGNAIGQNIDCEDQPYAYRAYASGLNGEIGYRTQWRHGNAYGYFTPTRQFRRDGYVCRSFTETTYSRGRSFTHTGTACRQRDGNWHFD